MILVDTSVWIDHLRAGNAVLERLLDRGGVLAHPFVVGELALGNLRQRNVVLGAMGQLPRPVIASDEEVLGFIAAARLFGRGIGYVDAHLLAAARLTPDGRLWTRDRRLRAAAAQLDLAAALPG